MALELAGNNADIQAFLNMLGRCMGLEAFVDQNGEVTRVAGPPTAPNAPFTETFDKLTSDNNTLTITVGRGQGNVLLDSYARREVDLDDLDQLPEPAPAGAPNAFTRCEDLIHILAEYAHALENGRVSGGAGFPAAHQAGLDAQNRHRAAKGQQGTVTGQTYNPATGQGTTTYSNGASTTVTVTGGNITAVTHTP